jgi:hypothetical protein
MQINNITTINNIWMDGMPLTYEEIKSFYKSDKLEEMLNNLIVTTLRSDSVISVTPI